MKNTSLKIRSLVRLAILLVIVVLLNIISHNALNLYGAVLSIITSIQTFASQWTPSIKVRVVLSSLVLAGCCLVALGASGFVVFSGLVGEGEAEKVLNPATGELLAQVPEAARNRSCICQRCATTEPAVRD